MLRKHVHLTLEHLEDRYAPATLTVTNLNDSGSGSLRAVIASANSTATADTIFFDSSLAKGTIALTTADETGTMGLSAFRVTTPITIVGTGQVLQRGGGAAEMRFFSIGEVGANGIGGQANVDASLTISNITFKGGFAHGGNGGNGAGGGGGAAGVGGAIYNEGTLNVTACTFDGNTAQGGNGGNNSGVLGGGGGAGVQSSGTPTAGSAGAGGGTGGGPTGGTSPGFASGGNGGATNVNGASGGVSFGGGGGAGASIDKVGGNGGVGGGSGGGFTSGSAGFGAGQGGRGANNGGGGGGGGFGGAIASYGGTVVITNSTFANNSARGGNGGSGATGVNGGGGGGGGGGYGGAIVSFNASTSIRQSTLNANTILSGANGASIGAGVTGTRGTATGAGVFNLAATLTGLSANATLTLFQSIFDNHTTNGVVADVANYRLAGVATVNANAKNILFRSLENSLGTVNAGGVQVTDPLLGTLRSDLGGYTSTVELLQNSPALNAGVTSINPASPITDQRGVGRDPTSPDLGAFEVQHPLSPVGVPTDLETTFSPKPSPDGKTALVKGLYQSTLLRAGEPAGIAFYVNILNNATLTPGQVVYNFINSPENRGNQVTFFYRYFLHREPDQAGLNFHIARLQSGLDEGDAMSGFILSPEFAGQTDNAAFVNLMYFTLLGRAAETAGFNFHLNNLNSGQSTRDQVLRNFLKSPEGIRRVIDSYYVSYLKRHGDAAGLSENTNAAVGGATFGSIATALLASSEFFQMGIGQMI